MPRRRVLAALAAAAGTGLVPVIVVVAAPPAGAILPDLVADAPQRPGVESYTYANGTQALLLRFDGYVHNRGQGPLEIRAGSRSGSTMTYVRQFVRSASGTMVASEPPPGPPVVQYETDDSHNHWHLREIARYSLWNSARTAQVAPAMKTGFCLVDSERIETHGPGGSVYTVGGNNFCGQGEPTRSSLTMGVSAGWRDLYHRYLSFQWVDVSNTSPGSYWVAAEIDTNGVVAESDEANNGRVFAPSATVVPGYVAQPVSPATVPAGGSGTVTLASQTFGSPGARRFRIQTLPANGVLRSGTTTLAAGSVVTGPDVTYVPNGGYSGPDGFTYSAFDSTSPYPRTPPSAAVSLTVGAPAPSVAISGAPQTLLTGASAQLSATVSNAAPGVTWSVNGVAGGNSTVGTITAAGLYTAPSAVPSGGSVRIRATSTSAPTAFAEVVVAIQAPPPPDPAPGTGTNLVRNPSFETATTGWGAWQGSVSRVTLAGAPDGVAVARVARTSGTVYTLDDSPETVAASTAGATYTARAYVRAASTSSIGKPVKLHIREWSPSGTMVRRWTSPTVTLTDGFQQLSVSGAALAGGDEIDVYVAQENAGTGDAMFVDMVSLTTGSGTPPPPPPANQLPAASFTFTPSSPTVGQVVQFTDTSTDPDGTVASRAWDLDDDGQYDDATGLTASRSFPAAGSYVVRVRVTDNSGASATTSRTVTVAAVPSGGTSLIANGSFESGLTGWIGWQSTRSRVQVADAPDGTWAARVAHASGTSFTIDDEPASVASTVAGATYTARAQVRADAVSSRGRNVVMYLRERRADGSLVRTVGGSPVTLTTAFQQAAVSVTPTTAGNVLDLFIGQSPAAAGDAFLVDQVTLVRTP